MLINKKAFEVYRAASTDPSRYALNGIRVKSDGSTEALDGHFAVFYKPGTKPDAGDYPAIDGMSVTEDCELKPFIIPTDACKDILQRTKKIKSKRYPIIADYVALDVEKTNANCAVHIGMNDLDKQDIIKPKKIDMEFPNTEEIMPKTEIKAWAQFNLDYVIKVCETMKACGVKAVRISLDGDPLRAQRFKGLNSDGDEIFAVIMPMRPDK